MYETHWKGLLHPSWEQEVDLQHSRKHILLYRLGTTDQSRTANRQYRRMRIGAAEREIARGKGERSASPGYDFVTLGMCGRAASTTQCCLSAHTFDTRPKMPSGGWKKNSKPTSTAVVFMVRFLDDPGPINQDLPLSPARYMKYDPSVC